jgi:hypothetical protein
MTDKAETAIAYVTPPASSRIKNIPGNGPAERVRCLKSSNNDHRLDREKMLHKFLFIGASALALSSSVLAPLPAVADDNDYFVLTQPNGKKIIISPISIVAIALPTEGLCKGETLIVTAPAKFCVIEHPEDVIRKLRDFPCVENPRTSAQTLLRCK